MLLRWCLVLVALLAAHPARADDADRIAALLQGESRVRLIEHLPNGAVFGTEDMKGRIDGELRVSATPPMYGYPRVITPSFYVTIQSRVPFPKVTDRLVHLANVIVAKDDGHLGITRQPVRTPDLPWVLLWQALGIAIAAVIVALVRRSRVSVELKLPHLIPALLQVTIIAYWSIYWPGVSWLVRAVLMQLALAYAWDAFLSLARFNAWKLGFGPIPIVLSANLFAWLNPAGTSILLFAAVGSRVFIRRGGRHFLNPSAAGLTTALALSYAFPDTIIQSGGPFTALTLAPNMGELILLLALLPQLRFRIVLASIGAYAGVLLASQFYLNVPGLMLPGMLLMLTLFLTDPATMPRTPLGQFFFGMMVGIGVAGVTAAGYALGATDERLNKVLPITLANIAAPWLDVLAERLTRRRFQSVGPAWNVGFVALWLFLMVPEFARTKPQAFNASRHWSYGTPIVVRDSDDVPRCGHNPIFCESFTFRREAAAWLARMEVHSSG